MISYRREDSWAFAGRVYDRLVQEYGRDRVFMDVDSIAAGDDFVAALEKIVAGCDALVAVIGKEWLTVRDSEGRRRIENPSDWVHVEIATALRRGIPVFPLLMPNVRMPAAADLPEPLKKLSRHNAVFTSETAFEAALDQLMAGLGKRMGVGPRRRSLTLAAVVAGVLGVLLLAGVLGYRQYGRWAAQGAALREISESIRLREEASDYPGAWKLANEAVTTAPKSAEARMLREDVGMAWLREVRGASWGEIVEIADQILPVLQQGAAMSKGERAADLHAHIGWANFLKTRGGATELPIIAQFEEAVTEDPRNPFAQAMWGDYLLLTGNDVELAQTHFREAISSGREAAYVREVQLRSLGGLRDLKPKVEAIRVANAMRTNGEALDPRIRHEVFDRTYGVAYREILPTLEAILPMREQLETFHWLREGRGPSERIFEVLLLARLLEGNGDCVGAFPLYVASLDSTLVTEAEEGIARCAARVGRGELERSVTEALHANNANLRRQVIDGLPHLLRADRPVLDPSVLLPSLVALLKDPAGEMRAAAGRSLSQVGKAAIPLMIQELESGSPKDIARAASVLGEMGSEAAPAVPSLVRLLSEGPHEARREIMNALANVGPAAEPAVPVLIRTIAEARENDDRQIAAYALGQIGPGAADSVPVLIGLVKDEVGDEGGILGSIAAEALGNIGKGAAAAVPALIEVLADERWRVSDSAFDALGKMGAGARPAVPQMIAFFKRSDAERQPERAKVLAEVARDLALTEGTRAKELVKLIHRAFQEENMDSSVIASVQAALDLMEGERGNP